MVNAAVCQLKFVNISTVVHAEVQVAALIGRLPTPAPSAEIKITSAVVLDLVELPNAMSAFDDTSNCPAAHVVPASTCPGNTPMLPVALKAPAMAPVEV